MYSAHLVDFVLTQVQVPCERRRLEESAVDVLGDDSALVDDVYLRGVKHVLQGF